MSMLNGIPPLTRDELDEAIRCNPDRKETEMNDRKCTTHIHVVLINNTTDLPFMSRDGDGPIILSTKNPIMCQCAEQELMCRKTTSAEMREGVVTSVRLTNAGPPGYSTSPTVQLPRVDAKAAGDIAKRLLVDGLITAKTAAQYGAFTAGSTRAELAEVIDETAPFTKEQIKKMIEFLEDYKAKTPGILAMGTPEVARLGGQPVYFDGKPLLRERPNQDKAVFSHVSLVPAGEGTGKVLGKFQVPDIKPDPRLAELMVESTKTLLEKIHHTKALILAIAAGTGVSIDAPIYIEPFFNGTKTDGFTVRDLRPKKTDGNRDNPIPAMLLLDRALANVGLEVSECRQSIPDERAASFTFRLKTTEFFAPKYLAWVDARLNHGETERIADWRRSLDELTSESPTLIAKPTEIPPRESAVTNIRQPWKGPDESKTPHQNLTDFFTHDGRGKKK